MADVVGDIVHIDNEGSLNVGAAGERGRATLGCGGCEKVAGKRVIIGLDWGLIGGLSMRIQCRPGGCMVLSAIWSVPWWSHPIG